MTLERIDPDGLASPDTYAHVVIASGSRLVFVAGQVAEDEVGNVVGPDGFRLRRAGHSPTWGGRSRELVRAPIRLRGSESSSSACARGIFR